MPTPTTVSDIERFVRLVESSALLSPAQCVELREQSTQHAEPKSLARWLLKRQWVTEWQARQLLAGRNAFQVGEYRLLCQLGSTNEGRTFLARHNTTQQHVMLRTLPTTLISQADPKIVRVDDPAGKGERYYVVMEYVGDRSLLEVVQEQKPLAPMNAADYIRQAIEKLAHQRAGVATHCEPPPVADPRSDMRDLGAMLYLLLSGQAPQQPARELTQLNGDLPLSLVEICERMMSADPDERFDTAQELKIVLDQWISQQSHAPPKIREVADAAPPPIPPEIKVVLAKPPLPVPVAPDNPRPSFFSTLPFMLIAGVVGGGLAALLMVAITVGLYFWRGSNGAQVAQRDQQTTPAKVDEPSEAQPADEKPNIAVVEKPLEPTLPKEGTTTPAAEIKILPPDPVKQPINDPPDEVPPLAVTPDPVEPASDVKPFADLAALVDLPDLGTPNKPNPTATDPVSLGKVKAAAETTIALNLLGGDKASGGRGKIFLFEEVVENQQAWVVRTNDGKGKEAMIARLTLKESELTFAWTAEAVQNPPVSGGLINCVLEFKQVDEKHRLVLRKPKTIAPLTVNMEKAAVEKVTLDLKHLPDAALLKLELTKVDVSLGGVFDKPTIPVEKGMAVVTFGEEAADQLLSLRIDTSLRHDDVILSLTPYLKVGDGPPKKFWPAQLDGIKAGVALQQRELFAAIAVGKQQKMTKAQLQPIEAQLKEAQVMMDRFNEVSTQLKSIASGSVAYRLVYQVTPEMEIEIASSAAAPK